MNHSFRELKNRRRHHGRQRRQFQRRRRSVAKRGSRQGLGDRRANKNRTNRGGEAVPCQSSPQENAAAGQPARQRAFVQSQQSGRIGPAAALQFAQHHRLAILAWQPLQRSVEQRQPVARRIRHASRLRHAFDQLLALPQARSPAQRLPGRAPGDGAEPIHQFCLTANRSRPANQHQKRGLKGVVGIRGRAEHPPAHGPHHRPMTAQQFLEGRFIALVAKAVQQRAVGQSSQFAVPVEVENGSQDRLQRGRGHGVSFLGRRSSLVNCRHCGGAARSF